MTDVPKAEIKAMLQNESFKNAVLDAMVSSADIESDLIGDIVDELSDMIEDDPVFKRELVARAFRNKGTKQRVLDKLVEELQ